MHSWRRYVAIGDSFTEGLCDDDPANPGCYRGWADRLAVHLAVHAPDEPVSYANLAVRGRLLAEVVGPQLDAAMALGPDLVSIVGGGNDILRPRTDVDQLAADLDAAAARIRGGGADVLLFTPVDPKDAPLIRSTRGRVATFVAHQHDIAHRHGAYLVDQWSMPVLRDWRLWAPDRIHLTADGHGRVAEAAAAALGLPVNPQWARPLPAREPQPRSVRLREDARWAREFLAPWVRRRVQGRSSGDQVSAKRPLLTVVEHLRDRMDEDG